MRKLSLFDVGAKFRVAHPKQLSVNKLPMPREEIFVVVKAFPMEPKIRLCAGVSVGGAFTLYPDTPVLLPGEPLPSLSEVEVFLLGKTRREVVGYRLHYVGQGRAWLLSQFSSHVSSIVEELYVSGITEFRCDKLRSMLDKYRHMWKHTDYDILLANRKLLHQRGVLEILYSDQPGQEARLVEVFGKDAI